MNNIVKEYLKQYAEDLKFVDDLAVEQTPIAKNMLNAFLQDQKLANLTRKHERRLRKEHAPIHRLSTAYRGMQLYARFCAWDDLHPDAGLYDSVWPAVKNRLDEIVGNN